jgi:hypothetical protein
MPSPRLAGWHNFICVHLGCSFFQSRHHDENQLTDATRNARFMSADIPTQLHDFPILMKHGCSLLFPLLQEMILRVIQEENEARVLLLVYLPQQTISSESSLLPSPTHGIIKRE